MKEKIKNLPIFHIFIIGLIVFTLIIAYYFHILNYIKLPVLSGLNQLFSISIPTYTTSFIDYYFYTFLSSIIYWIIPKKIRWIWLIIYSSFIILSWDLIYLLLIISLSVFTFFVGKRISKITIPQKRMNWLRFGIIICVTFLLGFKTINVFIQYLSLKVDFDLMTLLLPIGISFYTFQAISYLIDVNSGKYKLEQHIGHYYLYMSFFPRFVSGPIERADSFISQIQEYRSFNYEVFVDGIRQILWGLFVKTVIANRLFTIYNSPLKIIESLSPLETWVSVIAFSLYIYFDFYSYTHIALGTAKMFGFSLTNNFNKPYFSDSIVEFWRRWHISFSSWLRDYVFLPLEFSTRRIKSKWVNDLNIFLTFLISGIWHGATFNFLIWGGLHGIFQIIERRVFDLWKKITKNNSPGPILGKPGKIFLSFSLITLSWVFFNNNIKRSQTIFQLLFCSEDFFRFKISHFEISIKDFWLTIFMLMFFIILSLLDIKRDFTEVLKDQKFLFRLCFCLFLTTITLLLSFNEFSNNNTNFIYTQF